MGSSYGRPVHEYGTKEWWIEMFERFWKVYSFGQDDMQDWDFGVSNMIQLNIAIHKSDITKCQKEVRRLGKRFAKEIAKHVQEIILRRRKRIGIKVGHPDMKFVATTLGGVKILAFRDNTTSFPR